MVPGYCATEQQAGAWNQRVLLYYGLNLSVMRLAAAPENRQLEVAVRCQVLFDTIAGTRLHLIIKENVENSESQHVNLVIHCI